MKYKGIFKEINSEYSLGPVYNQDLEKLVTSIENYDYTIDDIAGNPFMWVNWKFKDKNTLIFAARENKHIVGFSMLDRIKINRDAYLHGFKIVGNKNNKARFECARLTITFGLKAFNLQRITATVNTKNKAAIQICKALGMHQEGIMKNAYCYNGTLGDCAMFGAYREDWL